MCIVGGSHSAAIRLKQLESEMGQCASSSWKKVVKLAPIHRTLDVLFPDWRSKYPDLPPAQSVTSSGMRLLTEKYSILIPHPLQMTSKGNYIGA
ncbi:hypothetical protein K438DRAFT_1893982 [Mycena galopus ATCC 62051]|nr:hypothetical protein K438DRAFT_1893982 [Mycena galopus ATCC 62051]